ncbi:DUF3572 domain-containing protein [Rhodobaculum claviforme]|uniref:DUF3572 domain-containing protein n=1 Tax=Rhodobaculum claviforme TaxID=1549854 RepID=A0A934WKP6_9RHOB|nr:DUF3572 domain-containing protein [Rhodobaculum claviforme]MBK5928783.1 hypothetical protein [Rhodobaculum claviforme]
MAEREIAETVALRALAWLMGPADLAETFLGASGLSPQDLRLRATEPETLAAVLDFVLMDDQWVLAFAAAEGVAPDRVARARAALPGGDLPHWT